MNTMLSAGNGLISFEIRLNSVAITKVCNGFDVVAFPGVKMPTGIDWSVVHDISDTSDWTRGFENIQCYDQLKVTGVLNQMDGKTYDGKKNAKVPEIFGMNFQAVSVGQKLIEKNRPTRVYVDGMGIPTPSLLTEFQFVNDSIGNFVDELKDKIFMTRP